MGRVLPWNKRAAATANQSGPEKRSKLVQVRIMEPQNVEVQQLHNVDAGEVMDEVNDDIKEDGWNENEFVTLKLVK